MKINGYDINIDSLMEDLNIEHDFYIKRKNGLMLKDSQIKISLFLKRLIFSPYHSPFFNDIIKTKKEKQ